MAIITFTKHSELLHLLLGFLLPLVLVQAATGPPQSVSTSMVSSATQSTSSPTNQPSSATQSLAVNQPAMTSNNAASTSTTQSMSSTSTGGGMAASETPMASTTLQTSASSASAMSTMTSSSTDSMTTMKAPVSSNISSMNMIYCPSFSCNNSDCYAMYMSQNATQCAPGAYCQLTRPNELCYIVGCSASCSESCGNSSQVNCTVKCCNYTGCMNDSFTDLIITTTTVITPTVTTPVPPTTSAPTTADKNKKCQNGTCTGSTCYTDFPNKALQSCSSKHPHCQLKKETVGSTTQWSAGCTNCTVYTACKQSTAPPCNMECCNATMTSSCLWLNGTLNVPSLATKCDVHSETIACLLCLLVVSLLI
ncbi:mucin-2 isoform X7 [Gouania willdenowi]|uniref:mucin-2 isoform X7 n=1 Tax=Gouania willdenowi TaxID=441366 RepID=UPI001056951F|nr:mucin-2-like isoform X7 [Gouania willdenowi]